MDKLGNIIDAQGLLEAQTYQRAAAEMLRKSARCLSEYDSLHTLGEVRAALLGHVQALRTTDELMREIWLEWRDKHGKG